MNDKNNNPADREEELRQKEEELRKLEEERRRKREEERLKREELRRQKEEELKKREEEIMRRRERLEKSRLNPIEAEKKQEVVEEKPRIVFWEKPAVAAPEKEKVKREIILDRKITEEWVPEPVKKEEDSYRYPYFKFTLKKTTPEEVKDREREKTVNELKSIEDELKQIRQATEKEADDIKTLLEDKPSAEAATPQKIKPTEAKIVETPKLQETAPTQKPETEIQPAALWGVKTTRTAEKEIAFKETVRLKTNSSVSTMLNIIQRKPSIIKTFQKKGNTILVYLTIKNTSGRFIRNITVSDTMPDDARGLDVATPGSNLEITGNELRWGIESLGGGVRRVLHYRINSKATRLPPAGLEWDRIVLKKKRITVEKDAGVIGEKIMAGEKADDGGKTELTEIPAAEEKILVSKVKAVKRRAIGAKAQAAHEEEGNKPPQEKTESRQRISVQNVLDLFRKKDLRIEKTYHKEASYDGKIAVYLTVRNNTIRNLEDVCVIDLLPYDASSIEIVTSGLPVESKNNIMKWTIKNLPNGGKKIIHYRMKTKSEILPNAVFKSNHEENNIPEADSSM